MCSLPCERGLHCLDFDFSLSSTFHRGHDNTDFENMSNYCSRSSWCKKCWAIILNLLGAGGVSAHCMWMNKSHVVTVTQNNGFFPRSLRVLWNGAYTPRAQGTHKSQLKKNHQCCSPHLLTFSFPKLTKVEIGHPTIWHHATSLGLCPTFSIKASMQINAIASFVPKGDTASSPQKVSCALHWTPSTQRSNNALLQLSEHCRMP